MNSVFFFWRHLKKRGLGLGIQALLFILLINTGNVWGGTVYFILGSDTAIWNYGSTVDVYTRHPHYAQSFFTTPGSPAFQVMDASWRAKFRDSYGNPIKFTWWMMGGNIYRDADNANIPTPNSMVLHLMMQYQGAAMKEFGDEVSLHYHTFYWSDYSQSGKYYWNQSRTFAECRDDFDYTLAQYLLDEGVYPVSFRSGWHFMDNDWQHYLNELLPFSMHNNWPIYKGWYTNQPVNNIQNWSEAKSLCVPFHPSTNNYQIAGNGHGWELRSIKMQSLSQVAINTLFQNASKGTDQAVCIWNHLPESFIATTEFTAGLIQTAATNYTNVTFRYCTAVEGMQRALGFTDTNPPVLNITEFTNNNQLSITIQSSKPLFQPCPFVACRNAFQQYSNITSLCISNGVNQWMVTIPMPQTELARVGIAAVDTNGNCTKVIRKYLPDDLYLDTQDTNYSELSGQWTNTTNAVWGTNARIANLKSPATAQWNLPITQTGRYALAIQNPTVTNASQNIVIDVASNSTSTLSITLSNGLPPAKWVPLGTAFLNSKATNTLVFSAQSSGQSNETAAVNVIRLIPLPGLNVPSPIFTKQPENRTNTVGNAVSFETGWFSFESARCQWYNQNGILTNQTNSILVFTNPTISFSGNYFMVASNSSGTATSAIATLFMNRPPTGIPLGCSTVVNQGIAIPMSDILALSSDPDGDPVIAGAWGYSDNWGHLSQDNNNILYTPATNFIGVDTFTYWLSDSRGGLTSLEGQVFVSDKPLPHLGHVAPIQSRQGWTLRYHGTAYQSCALQRSTDLKTWQTLDIEMIPIHGILDFKDATPPATSAFYRIIIP